MTLSAVSQGCEYENSPPRPASKQPATCVLSSWSGVPFRYLPREATCIFILALKAAAVTTDFQVKDSWVYLLPRKRFTEQIVLCYYSSSCLLPFSSFEVLLSRTCYHQSPLATCYCFPQWIYVALRSCRQSYNCKKLFKLNAAFLNKQRSMLLPSQKQGGRLHLL